MAGGYMYDDFIPDDDEIIDPYFCLRLKKFFDEITNSELYKCPLENECEKCKNYVCVEEFTRCIKIKNGKIEFMKL